jgi:hypothetical protein
MSIQTLVPSKIGFNSSIGTGNYVILSNASVVNPTGEQVSIVSTSASDTLAGTNIQKVKLRYYNTSWVLNDEIISLNGTTPVLSIATDILRIESFEAFQVGTGPIGAAGTITAKNLSGTNLFAQIDPTNNTFTRALHFVSPGKKSYMVDITLNCITSGGIAFLAFVAIDNTPQGGNIVLMPDTAFVLANQSTFNILQQQTICDASQSTQGLMIGIAVKGLAPSQIGLASFHFNDTR